MTKYKANALFEADIAAQGNSYLVIYGKHINGYYCCIPNWQIGCEMAEPSDMFYNRERLIGAGIAKESAQIIAAVIADIGAETPGAKDGQQNLKAKWGITEEQLHNAREKLKNIKICDDITDIALFDLLCTGDI